MRFVLRELIALEGDAAEILDDILTEAANFAGGVLAPLNQSGDKDGCAWRDGSVSTPQGFKEAFSQFAHAGWIGLSVPPEFGGQGLPSTLLAATVEMWHAANAGFANAPLLNQSAIEAIALIGSQEQKALYIPKLISGEWLGTMALTEPQAGSDLGQVRTKAVPDGAHYRVRGQKIFITFGEHDLTGNIIHLVLARLPDAPQGTKGISLFIVPKFVVRDDGSLGERNDVHCAGIEHKLGLHANPTCTMNYGEHDGAIGYLIGRPNEGLKHMFVMMNAARFSVGVQALGLAERAYQSAMDYARERVQAGAIIEHPDVRRMILSMKAQIDAMRALAYTTAAAMDRAEQKGLADFMVPIVKGWCTETALDVCSTAIQIFGGLGYIEETGIAQQYRDARVTTIYEGTTGIQALNLVSRKVARDEGATALAVIAAMREETVSEEATNAIAALAEATRWMISAAQDDHNLALAGSVPYLKLWGIVAAGVQMARASRIASDKLVTAGAEAAFYEEKITSAKFYASHILVHAHSLAREIIDGSAAVLSK